MVQAFVQGAAKHCQLGAPTAEEIPRKLFSAVDFDQVPAILVVDLFPRVGDFCHACAKLRSSMNSGASMFYIAVGEKSKELDWLRLSLNDDLVTKSRLAASASQAWRSLLRLSWRQTCLKPCLLCPS